MRNKFEEFEDELDLFSLEIDGVPVWERIRLNVFREIKRKDKGISRAHKDYKNKYQNHIKGISLLIKNIFVKNPFFSSKNDFLFIGFPRRRLENDDLWWDIYCDPIYEALQIDYLHLEEPYQVEHRVPAKTENLRYLDLVLYSGIIMRKLGLQSPQVSERDLNRINYIEAEIRKVFDLEIDLEEKIYNSIHKRNTTVDIYKRLLKSVNPKAAIFTRYYLFNTFIEACYDLGVPTIELQHGIISPGHLGYNCPNGLHKKIYPDYIFTFGEFWDEKINLPTPSNNIIPVGYPYLESKLSEHKNMHEDNYQIIFISQRNIGKELSKLAVELSDNHKVEHEIIYKLHPNEYDDWVSRYPWLLKENIQIVDSDNPPLYELFDQSLAQVGASSTAIYEGLCFNLDTYIYNCDTSELLKPLVNNGFAKLFSNVGELANNINKKQRNKVPWRRFFKSNATENIKHNLNKII